MRVRMTGRCYDLRGPKDCLVVATPEEWVPFDRDQADKLAASAMMLACKAEHVARLQREALATNSS
jgi:hypothetical protein